MHPRPAAALAALLLVAASACTQIKPLSEEAGIDSIETPELGACRVLTPEDVEETSNASEIGDCKDDHTAETFAVGKLSKTLANDADADDPALGAHIFEVCGKRFEAFLGGEESSVMRSTLTWAWFRPSDEAWDKGARWYRCDVLGGGEQSREFVTLPKTARGLLLGRLGDRWMVCVDGPKVAGALKIPCSQPHTWRAVTTIKLEEPKDPYPGDRLVEVRTRDFCSDSVGAWMNYPIDYDFGYTYFHEAESESASRRSICLGANRPVAASCDSGDA